ncbi:Alpha,alpha-trehalose-phosphate synthase (UDP-forming) [Pseudofrankia inefficax]|uniref:Alpha,alpha-trehalose-phosphate synthase (UDP-forming) n=1 Tax=Pseudofrankia inefficax (strain DSM 45817 / CECT 9037 / DDB 130130 / EuI1c) TaxID=298654 RepID=E3J4Q8_PSEI1|nr:Alpha,alpha-trehalose-phosphate synthase (UDP-forming) [Pseudofrankia inefficax]
MLAGPDPAAAGTARVLVASNRGPVAFSLSDSGALLARRGSGGLVSGMQEVIRDAAAAAAGQGDAAEGGETDPEDPPSGIVWVCAALSDADRRAVRVAPDGRLDRAGFDTGGAAIRMLDVDRVVFDRAYNGVANRTLWFVLHLLFAPASEPSFGAAFWRDWEAYEAYNAMFADALALDAAHGAAVLIQDYHLTLVPGLLRKLRPDLRISHFTHTPWAPPDYFRILPDRVSRAVIGGMLGADRLGFLTARWATAFRDCARVLLGDEVEIDGVETCVLDGGLDLAPAPGPMAPPAALIGGPALGQVFDERPPPVVDPGQPGHRVRIGVHPLGVDAPALRARAAAKDVAARAAELREEVGDRRLIVRVDRTELSKNIVRGLDAYRELLRNHPDWCGRVMHLVCAYPSRHDLPEYREYTAAVQRIATEIEDEFATDGWLPLRLEVTDDYPRSLAALTLADVLVVNPIRDGMNLIAKEGPTVSDRDVALILSREAGAYAELGADALVVNPYDVTETAEAMDAALRMPPAERRRRADRIAALAARLPPGDWFREQLAALPAPPAEVVLRG